MIENKIQSAIKPIISIYSKIELELIEKIAEHFKINLPSHKLGGYILFTGGAKDV